MGKLLFITLIFFVFISSVSAYDYVGLTDLDVKNYITFYKECNDAIDSFIPESFEGNFLSPLDNIIKKISEKYKFDNDENINRKKFLVLKVGQDWGEVYKECKHSSSGRLIGLPELVYDSFLYFMEKAEVDPRDAKMMQTYKDELIDISPLPWICPY